MSIHINTLCHQQQPSNFNAMNKKNKGFTLIEIMIVLVIMGILAGLIVPKLMGRTDDARVLQAKQDISTMMGALRMYKLDNLRYPTTDQGLQSLITRPTVEPIPKAWKSEGYISKLPKDPWGNDYQFMSPGLKSEIEIFSYGQDGQVGGAGYDADIGSWEL